MNEPLYAHLVFLLVMGAITAIGVVRAALWGHRARARRRLRSGISQVTDGEVVTVSGVVRPVDEPLIAPLSGQPCVVYLARAMVGTGSPPRRVECLRDCKMVSFGLVLPSGELAFVEGQLADLDLPPIPLIPRAVDREIQFLLDHDQPRATFPAMQFEETRVEPGDRVAVHGMVVVETDATNPSERGYRDAAPRKVRIVAHRDHPLTIGRPR
jgi:hypothetical protein